MSEFGYILVKAIQPIFKGARDLWAGRRLRDRENSRAQQLLEEQMKWSGRRSERSRQIEELAKTFSAYFSGGAERFDAKQLVAEIIEHRREVFMIPSETGSGKTVLALLLPLLCLQAPELRATALYLGPRDWDKGPPTGRVKKWISSCSSGTRKLIVFDSLDECLGDASVFVNLLDEARRHSPTNCSFLVLFRPLSARYAEDISLLLAKAFHEQAVEIQLEFDPADRLHCAAYCHQFPGLLPGQVSFLLRSYAKLFPDHRPSRMSAFFELHHLVDRFRAADVLPPGDLLPRPPGEVLFDAILGSRIDLDHPSLKLLSRVAFEILKDGRHSTTDNIESLSAKLGQRGHPVRHLGDSLETARAILAQAGSLITLQIDVETVRIPSETDVQVLAALHVARLFASPASDQTPSELVEQLRGTAKYDVCAQFVLPAYQRIQGTPEALFEGMDYFLAHDDASFSFCARLIHSNHDFSLLSRDESEELTSKLIRKLLQVIDVDRRKTCEQSIRDALAGPNPILDQLFVAVDAYGDSVVRLLVDHILHTSQKDLEKSQAAYLILHWLGELLAPSRETVLPARRHHIYTILNGLELLDTTNLHVRFHVMEVLDFLKSKSEQLTPMPGFSRRLDSLLVRYSGEVAVPEGDPRLVAIYGRCNRLVSSWAAAIGGEAAEDTLARAMEELLPPLLSAFQDQAKVVDGSGADLPVRELELFLECYEMLLGMARRAAYRSVKVDYLEFMLNAAESPFWIVRWWAFYNISYLVAGLPASDDYEYTVEECLDWMITQVYRTSEPIGLKHRQCALLEYTVKERPQSRAALRALFARRPPLDERKVEQVYANILRERATARRSLEDYFRKVSMLSRMDP